MLKTVLLAHVVSSPLPSFWQDKIPAAAKCEERRDGLMRHRNDTVSKDADKHTMTIIGK